MMQVKNEYLLSMKSPLVKRHFSKKKKKLVNILYNRQFMLRYIYALNPNSKITGYKLNYVILTLLHKCMFYLQSKVY